eukprot:scaffold905_cov28-Tisochrysis_lutea.AAC.4
MWTAQIAEKSHIDGYILLQSRGVRALSTLPALDWHAQALNGVVRLTGCTLKRPRGRGGARGPGAPIGRCY